MHYAAAFGYTHLLRILLEKHPAAIFEIRNTVHPIHVAAEHRRFECIELLVKYHRRHVGKSFFLVSCSEEQNANSFCRIKFFLCIAA